VPATSALATCPLTLAPATALAVVAKFAKLTTPEILAASTEKAVPAKFA
jgi:hypothetical protein